VDQWATLTPDQRFALLKLSRSNHENRNFLPALKEFQVI
jgi:Conserved nitrate reductase-associated protein (Nitr_red_assoc)